MSTRAPALRWVRYADVHYAALEVPPAEVPSGLEVPDGHKFVFFLDGESGAAVPDSDVLPYDPTDTLKRQHPEAQAGADIADQMLQQHHAATQGQEEATLGDLLALNDTEPKSRNKKSSKTSQARHEDDNDAQRRDEAENRRRRRRRDEEEEADEAELDNLLELGRGTARRAKKPLLESDDDDDDDVRNSSESATEESRSEEEDHWAQLEADTGMQHVPRRGRTTRDVEDSDPYLQRGTAHPSPFSYAAASGGLSRRQQSLVGPHLNRIHHRMEELRRQALHQDQVVSLPEYQVVEAVEKRLMDVECKVNFLTRTLENADGSERREIEKAIQSLRQHVDIDGWIQDMVELVPSPQLRAEVVRLRNQRDSEPTSHVFVDPLIAHAYHHAVSATPIAASQETVLFYVDQRKRLEQSSGQYFSDFRLRMGRKGLYRPSNEIRVLDRWTRSKTLLAVAPVQEAQLTKPGGFFNAKYSSFKTRMEEYALKQLRARRFRSGGGGSHGGSSRGLGDEDDDSRDIMARYRRQLGATGEEGNAAVLYTPFHDQPWGSSAAGGGGLFQGVGDAMQYVGVDPTAAVSGDPGTAANVMASVLLAGEGGASIMAQLSGGAPGGVEGFAEGVGHLPPVEFPVSNAEELLQVDEDTLRRQKEEAALKSTLYSATVGLLSQDSLLCNSDGEDSQLHSSSTGRHPEREGRRGGGRPHSKPADWRSGAKRAILEQLTLYLKGLKGKPKVLPDEMVFQRIAKSLLKRVTVAESENLKVNLTLEVHNKSTTFTKEMELRLKKSVDSYITRHYLNGAPKKVEVQRPAPTQALPATALHGEDQPVYQ